MLPPWATDFFNKFHGMIKSSAVVSLHPCSPLSLPSLPILLEFLRIIPRRSEVGGSTGIAWIPHVTGSDRTQEDILIIVLQLNVLTIVPAWRVHRFHQLRTEFFSVSRKKLGLDTFLLKESWKALRNFRSTLGETFWGFDLIIIWIWRCVNIPITEIIWR